VTEPRTPLEAALDLVIYAPVGLLLTAAEEIPKLAAKGRAQLGGQLAMAKIVGQFAVAQGRKELSRRFSPAAGPSRLSQPRRSGRPADTSVPALSVGVDAAIEDLPAADQPSGGPDGRSDTPPDADPRPASGPAASPRVTSAEQVDGGGAPDAAGLAIPGYDSLAASQVVQRLAGLSADELAAVGAYESSHRARRTILTRVRQLQER
jgi:hypothetical protein